MGLCFTLYGLVPKIHKSLLISERKYFNERKNMHSLYPRRRSSRNFLSHSFSVLTVRGDTLWKSIFFYWSLMWVVAWCVQLLYGPGSTGHLKAWLTLFMWVFRYVLKYLVELGLMLGRKYLLGQASRLKVSLFFLVTLQVTPVTQYIWKHFQWIYQVMLPKAMENTFLFCWRSILICLLSTDSADCWEDVHGPNFKHTA